MSIINYISTQKINALSRHNEGIYTILPYGKLILNKIERTLKKAMSELEIKEVLMPCVVNASVFAKRPKFGSKMFMISKNKLALAPTAEDIALSLPNILSLNKLYQIQLKFRSETRPYAGLIRGYEFIMKDSYLLLRSKQALRVEFKFTIAKYRRMFRSLGVAHTMAIADSGPLEANHSLEFAAPSVLFVNSYYVHAHSLKLNSARYLSFTREYVEHNKVLISSSYLNLTGLELAHAFLFGKILKPNAWFASLGIGVSRTLGYVLKHKRNNSTLLTVCDVAILNVTRLAPGYTRYVYCVLRCTTLNCVMFETSIHVSKLLGTLRRLPPILTAFINVLTCGFLVRLELQALQTYSLRRTHSLLNVITLAHVLKTTRVY
ncbi:MAG: aminoacyl--tRNA ligase-related protein [Candidatus Hodgkinia cicadicola]